VPIFSVQLAQIVEEKIEQIGFRRKGEMSEGRAYSSSDYIANTRRNNKERVTYSTFPHLRGENRSGDG
jgi:hypothetical protein